MMADETQLAGATSGDDTSGLIDLSLATRSDRNAAEAQTIGLAYNQYIFEARRKNVGQNGSLMILSSLCIEVCLAPSGRGGDTIAKNGLTWAVSRT